MTVLLLAALLAAATGAEQSRPAQATPRAAKNPDSQAVLVANASAALAAGRRIEARRLFKEAADRFQSVGALFQLARLQSADGDTAGALDSLQKARALAPNSEEVLSALGRVALAARLPVGAASALDALTRMCPDVAQYQYLLGVALLTAGDSVRAIEALQAADRHEPGRPLTLAALGLALNHRKQFAEAKTALTRSLELDPDKAESLAALAEAEASLGELDAAEEHARRALEIAPREATAHLVVGMVRLQQARYEEARDALLEAAAADSQSPQADYQLSLVYARLGDTAKAERSLESYRRKRAEMAERIEAIRAGALPPPVSRPKRTKGR